VGATPRQRVGQPEPDETIVRRYLESLIAPAIGTPLEDGLIEIAYGQTEPDKARLFPLGDLDQIATFAARVNRVGHQVWVGAALRRPGTHPGRRTKKTAFYASHFLWLDDAQDWAAAKVASADCPPDLIVCTGKQPSWRGQLLWRLQEPLTDGKAAFELITSATRGALIPFNANSPGQLRELLCAVAAYVVGGVEALADHRPEVVALLTHRS
jgi:hypothetical protein